jgi:energy-coupling factor transporter transmembrane protein EcfT
MVVGLRRAGELARAMEARGGPASISDDTGGPRIIDLLAIAVVVTAAATSLLS